jgi:transcription initiation factor TFIIIB Brf1 subunit/transcription initiation factor TFIIB
MIGACVFYACKLQGEPRSPKEIADIYDLEIKNVNKGCRRFLEYIDLEALNTEFNSSKSSDFIERFAEKLALEDQYIKIAKDISTNIHKYQQFLLDFLVHLVICMRKKHMLQSLILS